MSWIFMKFKVTAQECTWWGEEFWSQTKIISQGCPRWGDGIDPEFFVSSLYISVPINVRFFKFNMFII